MHPPPSPARADFSIMMELECAPEIGHCHSVGVLCERKCAVQYGSVPLPSQQGSHSEEVFLQDL